MINELATEELKIITYIDNYKISIRYILFYFICKTVFSVFISILDTLVRSSVIFSSILVGIIILPLLRKFGQEPYKILRIKVL